MLVVIACTSCDENKVHVEKDGGADIDVPDNELKENHCPHFIKTYIYPKGLNLHFYGSFIGLVYDDYELYSWNTSYEPYKEKYMALAQKHNDLTYGVEETKMTSPLDDCFMAIDFNGVNIVSDKEWDSKHPAGTSLNDVFNISVQSYQHFINNGYTYDGIAHPDIHKSVSELSPGDLHCIKSVGISFDVRKYPDLYTYHNISITFDVDGEEDFTISVVVDFLK